MAADSKDVDFAQVLKQSFDPDFQGLRISNITQLVPQKFDSIELSYTGEDVTEVIYKLGGSTVATLDLVYNSGKLISVTRS